MGARPLVVDHVEVADATAYEASQGSTGTELDTSEAVLTGAGLALLPPKLLPELALVSGSFAAQRAFVFASSDDRHRDLTGDAQGQPTAPTGPASTIDTSSR